MTRLIEQQGRDSADAKTGPVPAPRRGTTERKGAECPDCGSTDTPAKIGGWDIDGQRIRQRVCRSCTFRFVTVEVPVFIEDDRVIPYSWIDEDYRRRQRESARKRHGSYKGWKTKPTIKGVARLLVSVKVQLEKGMRPQVEHGTAKPLPRLSDPSIAPQHLVPVRDRIEIARRFEEGEHADTLAREYRISTRTVQRYANRYGEEVA